jgi:uncharacterized membrane protein YkvA (DUF1232 family)
MLVRKIFITIIKLMLNRKVPWKLKLIPLAGVIYVLSPLDFLPDVIPVLGWIDDILILVGTLLVFLGLSPISILKNTSDPKKDPTRRNSESTNTIDGEFRIVEKEPEHKEE